MWRAYPAQARDKVRTGSKARLRDEFVRVCGMVLRDNLMRGRRALERFINRRSGPPLLLRRWAAVPERVQIRLRGGGWAEKSAVSVKLGLWYNGEQASKV